MTKRISIALFLLLTAIANRADVCRPYTNGGGYARYLPTSAKLLTDAPAAGVALPSGVQGATIFVNIAPIRYRTDGVAPTSSEGVQIPTGSAITFNAETVIQLKSFQFIQVSAGSEVTISYCGGKGN